MDGSKTSKTNPKWRTVVILKKVVTSQHDRHEIWHSDASWPFKPYRQNFKISIF